MRRRARGIPRACRVQFIVLALGHWRVREFSRRREQPGPEKVFKAANDHAAELISIQQSYAEAAGLPKVRASLDSLFTR